MGTVASELLALALAMTEPTDPSPAFRWRSGDLGVARVELEDKEAVRQASDS